MTKPSNRSSHAMPSAAQALWGELVFLLAPRVFSVLSAGAGVALLLALVLPQAVAWLRPDDWPLPLFEASHFLSSIATTLLILLSFGLNQRMRTAWMAGVAVFLLTSFLAWAAGRHIAFAGVFAMAGVLLFFSREAFYRRGALSTVAVSPEPAILIALALAGAAWIGFFAYRNVEYSDQLWWTFAADADASRFLRALVISAVTLLVFVVWRLMQPPRAPGLPERSAELEARIEAAVSSPASTRPDAALAWLPDKRFRFSEDGSAFIMYGVRGRNWIAMGPPVGPPEAGRALAFAMKREADLVRANLIFYSTPTSFLPVALDLGLTVLKIGETALIDLPDFTMEGSSRARLRQSCKRAERDGCAFDVLEGEAVDAEMSRLEEISRGWLHEHHGAEKAFTLGRFDPEYIRRFPIAVMRRNGEICAFTNVWVSGDGAHLAIDLMRQSPDAPSGVMDVLFVGLAQWGRDRGARTLDLGMAPLAGLAAEREADPLSRIGALVYSHGEELYGFEGLRQYKDKFHPRWEPVYLAAPGRVSLATAMADVALLTSGGLRGLFARS
ncbi:MAG: phosphatidylglycerol lysyltransferase domain-containing protein [Hyphomonadaceae bacterium]